MTSTEEADLEQHDGSIALSTLWWILGIFSTVVMTAGGAWLAHVDSELSLIKGEQQNKIAKIATLEEKVNSTTSRLERIEDKLDIIIEKLPRR